MAMKKTTRRANGAPGGSRRRAPKNLMLVRAAYASGSLEQFTVAACSALPDLEEREVPHPNYGVLRINWCVPDRNGAFLHVIAKQTGELASTVSDGVRGVSDQDIPVPAPANRAFKNADLFALIKGNNVLVCSDGIRYETLEYYLRNFFGMANLGNQAAQFSLSRVANTDPIAVVQRGGVKEIAVDATLYAASVAHINDAVEDEQLRSLPAAVKSLVNHLGAVFKKDTNEELAHEAEHLQVRVVLKAEGGSRGESSVLDELANVGLDLVEEPEDLSFSILTNDHKRVRSSDLTVWVPVKFERGVNNNSLSPVDVLDKMVEVFQMMERRGDLEV